MKNLLEHAMLDIALFISFLLFTAKKSKKIMADVNATVEGFVATVKDATSKIATTLSTVQTELNDLENGNPLTEQTQADMTAALDALEALANAPAPTATPAS